MKVSTSNKSCRIAARTSIPTWESVKWCKEYNKYNIYPVNTTKPLLNKKKTTIGYLAGFSTLLLIPF